MGEVGGDGSTYPSGAPFTGPVCSENSGNGGYPQSYINDLKMNGSAGFMPSGGGSYFSNRAGTALNGLDNGANASRTKRGVLPKRATQVMKQWLFQHLVVGNFESFGY